MAKKKEKGKKNKGSSSPAEQLRDAVERTFQGAGAGAGAASKRAQELFDDLGTAMQRLREAVDERRVLETLEHLRDEVQKLAGRVNALERGSTPSAPAPARRTPARRASTAAKPAAKRASTAAKRTSTAAKRTTSTAAKRTSTAAKPAAKRASTAAKRTSSAAKPAAKRTTRSTGTRSTRTPRGGSGSSS